MALFMNLFCSRVASLREREREKSAFKTASGFEIRGSIYLQPRREYGITCIGQGEDQVGFGEHENRSRGLHYGVMLCRELNWVEFVPRIVKGILEVLFRS